MSARPRQISDDEILKVACECFLENGPGVSVQVIADRLGISQPALFKRFNTKEELLFKSLMPTPATIPVLSVLKDGPKKTEPFFPQLEQLLFEMWKTVETVFPRIALLAMSGSPQRATLLAHMKNAPLVVVLNATADWIAEAQRQGHIRKDADPVVLAQTCLGPLQGRAIFKFILQADFQPPSDPKYKKISNDKSFIRQVADQLYRGMSGADLPASNSK